MSRYCGDRDSNAILEAATHWRQNCLLKDVSVFTDKSLWQLKHLMELVRGGVTRGLLEPKL